MMFWYIEWFIITKLHQITTFKDGDEWGMVQMALFYPHEPGGPLGTGDQYVLMSHVSRIH